jgi:type II secretory pathway pseudopilin PulG
MKLKKNIKGFSLVELIVSIGIFIAITALVIFKYGSFNQSTLLTNLAYDMALTIRTAQTYGLGSKNASETVSNFQYAYGVEFDPSTSGRDKLITFTDSDANNKFSSGESTNQYSLKRGAIISNICTGSNLSCDYTLISGDKLDILFKRPYPDAIINLIDSSGVISQKKYVLITVQGTDGSTRSVEVTENGQITVN